MNRIKELRTVAGLSQYELAKKVGLNQTAVGKYEREQLEPSISTLKKMSEIFECSIDYILGHSDDLGVISIKKMPSAEQLTAEEQRLLDVFRKLNTKNRMHVSAYAEVRLEDQGDSGRLPV